MDVFPELNTARLKLRKIGADDISALVRYANNKKVSDHVLNIPYPYDEPEAVFRISYVLQGFKNKLRYVFAIILKERNELIGEIGLHFDSNNKTAQLGYWVGEPFWGQGIASEATAEVLKFGFEKLALEKIYATCHADNPASGKVLLNNEMVAHNTSGNVTQYIITQVEYKTQVS